MSGARARRDEGSAAVTFVTAFDQHAMEACGVNAVDYLLKPVDATRLDLALQRARKRLSPERQPGTAPLHDQLERIVKMMSGQQVHREPVAVKVGERFLLVQAEDMSNDSMADEALNIVPGQGAGALCWDRCAFRVR